MDAQAIRLVAFELLHAHEAMSPVALAETCKTTPSAVCGALGADDRFTRVAGDGCWWWALSPLSHVPALPGTKRRGIAADQAPPPDDGGIARADRQRSANRERLRGFLGVNASGATIGRIRDHLGLAGDEVLDLLRGLEALGEVASYQLCDLTLWKPRAA
jgi:hypothetical protein